MTTFGIDVSRYQEGLSLAAAASGSVEFAVAKATEGQGLQDPQYNTFRAQAEEAGLLFAGYHFLRDDSAAVYQARNAFEVVGPHVPLILDVESGTAGSRPKMARAREFRVEFQNLGGTVSNLLYLPKWYWDSIGRPDVTAWDVWQSAYGDNSGDYPGDSSHYWAEDGTFRPMVLQYTSRGRVPGYPGDVDLNAFRGTRAELAAKGWFKDYGDNADMATREEVQAWVASTPIVVNTETKETQPLQKVLRRILEISKRTEVAASDEPTLEQIAQRVLDLLPPGQDVAFTEDDLKNAVKQAIREGTGA